MSPDVYAAFEKICREESIRGPIPEVGAFPGFRGMGTDFLASPGSFAERMVKLLTRLTRHEALQAGTLTLREHFYPGDYYRFTEQALR